MSQSPAAKAKADRFPAELRPHPGYEYELPRKLPNGCVEIDAGVLSWAADIAAGGLKKAFPKERG
jgi:hypothetical protein